MLPISTFTRREAKGVMCYHKHLRFSPGKPRWCQGYIWIHQIECKKPFEQYWRRCRRVRGLLNEFFVVAQYCLWRLCVIHRRPLPPTTPYSKARHGRRATAAAAAAVTTVVSSFFAFSYKNTEKLIKHKFSLNTPVTNFFHHKIFNRTKCYHWNRNQCSKYPRQGIGLGLCLDARGILDPADE